MQCIQIADDAARLPKHTRFARREIVDPDSAHETDELVCISAG